MKMIKTRLRIFANDMIIYIEKKYSQKF